MFVTRVEIFLFTCIAAAAGHQYTCCFCQRRDLVADLGTTQTFGAQRRVLSMRRTDNTTATNSSNSSNTTPTPAPPPAPASNSTSNSSGSSSSSSSGNATGNGSSSTMPGPPPATNSTVVNNSGTVCSTDVELCTCSSSAKPYYLQATFTLTGMNPDFFSAPPVLASFKETIRIWMNETQGLATASSDVHIMSGLVRRNTQVEFRVMMAETPSSSQMASMSSFLTSTANNGTNVGFVAAFTSHMVARNIASIPPMSVSAVSMGSSSSPPPPPPWHEEHKDKAAAALIVILILCLVCWFAYFIWYCCCEVVTEGGPPPGKSSSKYTGEAASSVGMDLEMNSVSMGDSSDLRRSQGGKKRTKKPYGSGEI